MTSIARYRNRRVVHFERRHEIARRMAGFAEVIGWHVGPTLTQRHGTVMACEADAANFFMIDCDDLIPVNSCSMTGFAELRSRNMITRFACFRQKSCAAMTHNTRPIHKFMVYTANQTKRRRAR